MTVDEEAARDEDFRDAVLARQEWSGRSFANCDFTDADMSGMRIRNCVFDGCTFDRTDFGDSEVRASAFRSCHFDRAVFGNPHGTVAACWARDSSTAACVRARCAKPI